MFIQTEDTPNPHALKFLLGVEILAQGTVFFHNIEEATNKSPLAANIFKIGNIQAVFYGKDFITITKAEDCKWDLIKSEILMTIMDHIVSGLPILEESSKLSNNTNAAELSDIEKQIIEIIDTRVRPSVALDGGDIIYQSFENGTVYLELRGACSGCPSSSITLKNGIESMLQHFVPEVKSVEAVPSSQVE